VTADLTIWRPAAGYMIVVCDQSRPPRTLHTAADLAAELGEGRGVTVAARYWTLVDHRPSDTLPRVTVRVTDSTGKARLWLPGNGAAGMRPEDGAAMRDVLKRAAEIAAAYSTGSQTGTT
jgi:hypothetical protein